MQIPVDEPLKSMAISVIAFYFGQKTKETLQSEYNK